MYVKPTKLETKSNLALLIMKKKVTNDIIIYCKPL